MAFLRCKVEKVFSDLGRHVAVRRSGREYNFIRQISIASSSYNRRQFGERGNQFCDFRKTLGSPNRTPAVDLQGRILLYVALSIKSTRLRFRRQEKNCSPLTWLGCVIHDNILNFVTSKFNCFILLRVSCLFTLTTPFPFSGLVIIIKNHFANR